MYMHSVDTKGNKELEAPGRCSFPYISSDPYKISSFTFHKGKLIQNFCHGSVNNLGRVGWR